MSIHLNGLHPVETLKGVCFSADVNGKTIECVVSYDALTSLETGRPRSALTVFRQRWPDIRDAAYERLRNGRYPGTKELVLTAKDFAACGLKSRPSRLKRRLGSATAIS